MPRTKTSDTESSRSRTGLDRRTFIAAGVTLPAAALASGWVPGLRAEEEKAGVKMRDPSATSELTLPATIRVRRASERGYADHGWLRTYHTFSFADYYDPANMGYRALRVINEDRVSPAKGFGTHPHRDMEIISYVLEGQLQHRDSMGNGSVIRPGEVQRMTAGTGVTHSEFNASSSELVHFLQIWIVPERRGLTPGYEQKAFPFDQTRGQLTLVASPDGEQGSVTIHQDARVFAGRFDPRQATSVAVGDERHGWVHVARGTVLIAGERLEAGDAIAMSGPCRVRCEAGEQGAEVLVFDLA